MLFRRVEFPTQCPRTRPQAFVGILGAGALPPSYNWWLLVAMAVQWASVCVSLCWGVHMLPRRRLRLIGTPLPLPRQEPMPENVSGRTLDTVWGPLFGQLGHLFAAVSGETG